MYTWDICWYCYILSIIIGGTTYRDQVGPRDCANHAYKSQIAHNCASDGRKMPILVQNRPYHRLICVKMGTCRP